MEEKNINALEKAKKEFSSGEPFLMAECSGAEFEKTGEDTGFFKLRYLNQDYHIGFPGGEIIFADTEKDSLIEEGEVGCGRPILQEGELDYSGETILISDQILMLYYLRYASGLPSRGRWINYLELPNGGHHHSCFIEDAINPMIEKLVRDKEGFLQAARLLGGKPIDKGDYGACIPVFPEISLFFIAWEGDEEFPPNGNILFDSVISTYLDTASIYVLGINTVMRLIYEAGKTPDDKGGGCCYS